MMSIIVNVPSLIKRSATCKIKKRSEAVSQSVGQSGGQARHFWCVGVVRTVLQGVEVASSTFSMSTAVFGKDTQGMMRQGLCTHPSLFRFEPMTPPFLPSPLHAPPVLLA